MAERRGPGDPSLFRIERLLSRNPDLSDRKAILAVDGDPDNTRSHQGRILASRKRTGAATIAERFPASSREEDGRLSVSVLSPGHGEGDTVLVTVEHRPTGRRSQDAPPGLTCHTILRRDDVTVSVDGNPATALEALGVGLVTSDGALEVQRGPSPLAVALGRALHAEWVGLGCKNVTGLMVEAVAHEGQRLARSGVGTLSALVDDGSRRLAAAYGSVMDPRSLAPLLVTDADRQRRSLLLSVASFAGRAIACAAEAEPEAWTWRPAEFLARVLGPGNDGVLRRPLDIDDARWLLGILGGRAIEPVGSEATLLIRSRARLDHARIETDRDAGAIAATAKACQAVARAARCDATTTFDAVLDRITEAGGSGGYGEALLGMSAVEHGPGLLGPRLSALPPLPRALAAATFGIESLVERVALDLILPLLALDDQASGRPGRDHAAAAAALRRVGNLARSMVMEGRTIADLAAVVERCGMSEHASDAPTRCDLQVAVACERLHLASRSDAAREDLDLAWRRMGPSLTPRWRNGGQSSVLDLLWGAKAAISSVGPPGPSPGRRLIALPGRR